ncbi:MAG: FGGY-family carbohydrate kinase [Candidatus Hermodarchaeota archaeon]
MSDLICVFDCGTTGTRTIVFDINGKEIAKAYEEYQIPKQPVGISEQDPIIWWNAIKSTCNKVANKVNVDEIIGICASFHRATASIVDKNGEVLHPALTWMDEREVVDASTFHEDLRRTVPKILWLKNNKPDIFNQASKIIFPDTYIYMNLCGKDVCVTEPTNGIWGIMSKETLDWDPKLAESYGLELSLWPDLRTPGEIIGELSSEAAGDLGLKPNTPIMIGGGDQQCAALGLGVIEKGQAKVTIGTGTFVDYITGDEPATPAGDVPIFPLPHVIKGKWLIEGSMPGTGTAMKWFKDNFSQLQVKECEKNNLDVYEVISNEAKDIPPGSEGLLFVPLYIFRKGTIHGLGWNHTRAHMIRSIMESSALSAQMYLGMLEAIGRGKVTEIKADGGGMNSDLWAQIFADVLGRKVIVPENKDGAALGAAILGFYGCKKYSSFNDAIENMVRFEKEYNPIKANVKIYKKLNRLFMPTLLEIFDKKRVTKDL